MVPECFVDGDIANWMAQEEDPVGLEISGLIVYHPQIGKKTFINQCDWLEDREFMRGEAIMDAAAKRGFPLAVIDERTIKDAEDLLEAEMGESFLATFINDTRQVALKHLGEAIGQIKQAGIASTPGTAAETITIEPAKSFRSEKSLAHYLHEGRGTWKPSVRLSFSISIDGPWNAVESAGWQLRLAFGECGPVTEWRQRIRPAAHVHRAAALRVVAG